MRMFTDADWAGDILTRRSTTRYIAFVGVGPIAWQFKLQTTVSTSSVQSEYQAMYSGMQRLVWLWCLASCRWLCVNPQHFSWTVKVLKTWLSTGVPQEVQAHSY